MVFVRALKMYLYRSAYQSRSVTTVSDVQSTYFREGQNLSRVYCFQKLTVIVRLMNKSELEVLLCSPAIPAMSC